MRSDYIPRIQEVQASIYHMIRETLEVCAMAKLELYGTASCPYTREMREWLEWKGNEFDEYDVEADAEAVRRECARWPEATVPVPLLVEDGKVIQVGWQGRGCVVAENRRNAKRLFHQGARRGAGRRISPFVYRLARANDLRAGS